MKLISKFLIFALVLCKTLCFAEEPIAVYLTWLRSPETTMFIQWITPNKSTNDVVTFCQEDTDIWISKRGNHSTLPAPQNSFFLHRIELNGLIPNTTYYFKYEGTDKLYKFKTMPSELSSSLNFVVGGDLYHDSKKLLEQAFSQVAKTNPYFALIGGDIAYSGSRVNFFSEKSQRWLDFFKLWSDNMITSQGYLIPIIPAIGNHETNGHFNQTPNEAPFFYYFFPMPGRWGYNILDFSNYLTLILLDSGHTHPIPGNQTNWLWNVLEARQNVPHKIALYHVPAYPSVNKFHNKYSVQIRKSWVPIFEKFGLDVAFENHCHAYKRSQILYNGKVSTKGVVYLGDGGWGVKKMRKPQPVKDTWYLAKTDPSRHFISVSLDASKRKYQALDMAGNIIDQFTQTLETYPKKNIE